MGILDDIPRNEFFSIPDRYFEKLPARIHARLALTDSRRAPVLRYALTYLLPLLLVATIAIMLSRPSPQKAEDLLSQVATTDLIAYLQESEVSTEEITDQINLTVEELEALENEVYEWDIPDTEGFFIDHQ